VGLYKDYQKDKFVKTVKKGDLEYVELLRVSPWITPHANQCSVCNHEKVAEIEHGYLDWATYGSIEEVYGIKQTVMQRHAKATGMAKLRMDDRKRIYEKIVERALQSGATPSIGEALNAMQHLDKLEGKVVEKREVTTKTAEQREEEYGEILKLLPGGGKK
jgi:hypothetical protein